MSLIERAIAAVSPGWALARAQNQIALEQVRKYDAAQRGRRTKGWQTDGKSPRAETLGVLGVLRSRARDLANNNPLVEGAIDKLNGYQVGAGIQPRSATGNPEWDKAADALWRAATGKGFDWNREHDVYGIQSLANRCRIESGESLIQFIPLTADQMRNRGLPIPLAVYVKEPDWLDDIRLRADTARGYVEQGVQFTPDHQIDGYWMFDHHPGDALVFSGRFLTSNLYPKQDVVHLFRTLRAGQIRGVTELRSIMLRMRMLDDIEDASLERLRTQACLAAFVTSNAAPAQAPLAGRTNESGDVTTGMRPGMVARLLPGEDVKFATPGGDDGSDALARRTLRAAAEGLGMPYDMFTGDLSAANYSSLRAGRLVFRRRNEVVQWLTLVPRMGQPIWDRVMMMGQMLGLLPDRGPGSWPAKWSPPRFEMLDPLAEFKAMTAGVRGGFMTMQQAISELGFDPETQIDEIEQWNELLDEAGVILDTDPRRIAGAAGQAQDPAQNAVVELNAKPDAAAAAE